MDAFWRITAIMLRDRLRVGLAALFLVLSAVGLGAGVLSVLPMLKMIIADGERKSLVELANEHNADAPLISVPDAVIAVLPADPFHGVALILGFVVLLTLFGGTCNFLHQFISVTLVTRTIARLRLAAFRSVVQMPLSSVVARGPAEFVAKIVRDAAEIQIGLLSLTSRAMTQISKGTAAFAVAIIIEWRLTLVAVILAPVMAVILRKFGKRIRRGTNASLQGQQDLLRIAGETIQGLRAVKVNTGERRALARFHRVNKEVMGQEFRVRNARAISSPAIEAIAVVVICGLALFAARQIIDGRLDFTRFFVALAALGIAGGAFRPLTQLVNSIQAASAPARRLMEVIDEPREATGDRKRPALPRHHRSIRIEHVRFTYPGSDEPAIVDLSMSIGHGERVAIVGPNGCGKTTLVSMVPRLLVPTSGRILIDDIDVQSVNLRSLRRQIGVVTQDTVLFRASVADNIGFGATSATREAIIDAARAAHADEFIGRLQGGYDANLAEQGASLSGGQRQRLAIARAILRDPSILILDEATSQIDAESEAHINDALHAFCRTRTSLIIAHRLTTVVSADRIVVMDGGRIDDIGTHNELLQRCELYQRLTRTQLVGSAG